MRGRADGREGVRKRWPEAQPTKIECYGLTKREEFAKAAMVGLLSDHSLPLSTNGMSFKEFIAKSSVEYADALLEALENDNGN